MDTARVDQWLWAIRLFPTRTAANEACRASHVRLNGSPAKPAARVKAGDRISARVGDHDRMVEVVTVIEKRVGAASAAECFIDHTPPAAPPEEPVLWRDRGSGRPTKRDRRKIDQLRQ